jgi:hypothetical protein
VLKHRLSNHVCDSGNVPAALCCAMNKGSMQLQFGALLVLED